MTELERNVRSQQRPTPHPHHTGAVHATKHRDGTVTTSVWPSPGVVAVATLLRSQYLSEYETDASVEDWFPQAIELVGAYLGAEGEA